MPDWSKAAIMRGKYGTTFIPLAVDEDGNVIGVFKGLYAGELKTLAVDEYGRIPVILTDPEDVFGNPNYIGAGELATRLGCPTWFDKRGNVFFFDNFEAATLRWEALTTGTGASIALSTTRSYSGVQSVLLTAGSDSTRRATIMRHFGRPPEKRLGISCMWAYESTSPQKLWTVMIWLQVYTTSAYYDATLYYDITDDTVKVVTDTGINTVSDTLNLYLDDWAFHNMKVVLDWETTKYVRGYLDDNEFDLSEYGLQVTALANQKPKLLALVRVLSAAGQNAPVYIDDVVLTQNEP